MGLKTDVVTARAVVTPPMIFLAAIMSVLILVSNCSEKAVKSGKTVWTEAQRTTLKDNVKRRDANRCLQKHAAKRRSNTVTEVKEKQRKRSQDGDHPK